MLSDEPGEVCNVRVHACDVCACMSVYTCVQACEGQRTTLGIFLTHSPHYLLVSLLYFLFTYLFGVEGVHAMVCV